ncbi:hypothetical protein RD2015_1115 [Roseateles depolymerans]|uniref:Uncharacterized protein n=3 Tax=Roseateles depolymerans TaxID=76731 RepID=A0A0U3CA05_9BURK|nr:hypothetical protein RD2015_1115 [Roseateles depolymerans]
MDSTAPARDGYSPRCCCIILTARSRTSGENLFDLLMAQSSQSVEPPRKPGRFSHRELRVGDRILVEVLDAPTADPAESGHEARQREHDEREYFEHCKKAYLDLKAKYETSD